MKRLNVRKTAPSQIQEFFSKHKLAKAGIVAAAVLLVAAGGFSTLMRECKEVAQSADETSSSLVPRSGSVSAETDLSTLAKQMEAMQSIIDASYRTDMNTVNYMTTSRIYSTGKTYFDKKDICVLLKKMNLSRATTKFAPEMASFYVKFTGRSDVTINFYRNSPSQATFVEFEFSNYPDQSGDQCFEYQSTSSAYDIAMENLTDQTIHASKVTADKFMTAFSGHDTDALKQLSASPASVDEWALMQQDIHSIQNLHYEPLAVYDTHAVYQVSFDTDSGNCSPFLSGHNERILEIDKADDSNTLKTVLFCPPALYNVEKTPCEQLCSEFITFSGDTLFDSTDQLDTETMLRTIIGDKIVLKRHLPSDALSLTQPEVDQLAQSFFGIDQIGGTDSPYYDCQSGTYSDTNFTYQAPVFQFVKVPGDDANTATAVFFKDSMQSLPEKCITYTFQTNDDGTYRFISAVNRKESDIPADFIR